MEGPLNALLETEERIFSLTESVIGKVPALPPGWTVDDLLAPYPRDTLPCRPESDADAYTGLMAWIDDLVEAFRQALEPQERPPTHQLAVKNALIELRAMCLQLWHWRADVKRAYESGRRLWLDERIYCVMKDLFAGAHVELAALTQDVRSPFQFHRGPLHCLSSTIDSITGTGRAIIYEGPDLSLLSDEEVRLMGAESGSDEAGSAGVCLPARQERYGSLHVPTGSHATSDRDAAAPVADDASSTSTPSPPVQVRSSVARHDSSEDTTQRHCRLSTVHNSQRSAAAIAEESAEYVHPFNCPFCPQKFTRRHGLGTHILAHEDVCDACGRVHDSQDTPEQGATRPISASHETVVDRQEQIQGITVKRLPDIEASRPERHAQGVVESVKQGQEPVPYAGIEPTMSSQVSQAGKVRGYSERPKHDSRAVCEESYDASSSSADEDDDDSADDDLSDTSSSVSGVAAEGGQKQNRHF
ncbi:hypothetical protein LTR10_010578 [Elasticomyces elasticus]|nr:hypothetical protein LTR10_010578 [Elasticomyces elasticus]KAK4972476.1 hypothetical protein LTR42_006986 [Elasticomyces elasticus]